MEILADTLKKGNWSDVLEAEPIQPVFRQA